MSLPVGHPWFVAEDMGEGITRLIERYIDPLLESNVWHVSGRDRDMVVDFANGVGALRPAIDPFSEGRPVIAVATHGHFDHIGGLHEFEDRRVHEADAEMARDPFPLRLRREDFTEGTEDIYDYYGFALPDLLVSALPAADFDVAAWSTPPVEPTVLLHEGDDVDLGDRRFVVLHLPGHTAGSIGLWEADTGILFSGDALYVDARLSWDDATAFVASLERIAELPITRVHAGHDRSFAGGEVGAAVSAALADPDLADPAPA
jgi:glyoxylase-like metal-dependent hydrolase (beta-lactamase superfamily II)